MVVADLREWEWRERRRGQKPLNLQYEKPCRHWFIASWALYLNLNYYDNKSAENDSLVVVWLEPPRPPTHPLSHLPPSQFPMITTSGLGSGILPQVIYLRWGAWLLLRSSLASDVRPGRTQNGRLAFGVRESQIHGTWKLAVHLKYEPQVTSFIISALLVCLTAAVSYVDWSSRCSSS